MYFQNAIAAKDWMKANKAVLDELVDYALNLPETLYVNSELHRPGSGAPSHIQVYDHDLKQYASVRVNVICTA